MRSNMIPHQASKSPKNEIAEHVSDWTSCPDDLWERSLSFLSNVDLSDVRKVNREMKLFSDSLYFFRYIMTHPQWLQENTLSQTLMAATLLDQEPNLNLNLISQYFENRFGVNNLDLLTQLDAIQDRLFVREGRGWVSYKNAIKRQLYPGVTQSMLESKLTSLMLLAKKIAPAYQKFLEKPEHVEEPKLHLISIDGIIVFEEMTEKTIIVKKDFQKLSAYFKKDQVIEVTDLELTDEEVQTLSFPERGQSINVLPQSNNPNLVNKIFTLCGYIPPVKPVLTKTNALTNMPLPPKISLEDYQDLKKFIDTIHLIEQLWSDMVLLNGILAGLLPGPVDLDQKIINLFRNKIITENISRGAIFFICSLASPNFSTELLITNPILFSHFNHLSPDDVVFAVKHSGIQPERHDLDFLRVAVRSAELRKRLLSHHYVEMATIELTWHHKKSAIFSDRAAVILSVPEIIHQLTDDDLLKLTKKTWDEMPQLLLDNPALKERMKEDMWLALSKESEPYCNVILNNPDITNLLTDKNLLDYLKYECATILQLLQANPALKERMNENLWLELGKETHDYRKLILNTPEILDLFSDKNLLILMGEAQYKMPQLLQDNPAIRKRMTGDLWFSLTFEFPSYKNIILNDNEIYMLLSVEQRDAIREKSYSPRILTTDEVICEFTRRVVQENYRLNGYPPANVLPEYKQEPIQDPIQLPIEPQASGLEQTMKATLALATSLLIAGAGTGIASVFVPHILTVAIGLLAAALLAFSAYGLMKCYQHGFFSSAAKPLNVENVRDEAPACRSIKPGNYYY
ncbi:MAG: hypothetical protein P4M14_06205 [Gammaproteobacteria bacterium]|nr:hypothetical protein [Gammaproteobacteria bacterium]